MVNRYENYWIFVVYISVGIVVVYIYETFSLLFTENIMLYRDYVLAFDWKKISLIKQ